MSLHHTDDLACPLCTDKLQDAHPTMREWFLMLKARHPSVHCSWVYRGPAEQELFFNEGRSRCRYPNSKHNQKPSKAIDIFQIDADGVARWSKAFALLVDKENQEAKLPILSGKDIVLPNGGRDYLHFQLKEA